MSVMAVVTAEGAVVNIHTLGAMCEGILTLWVFLIFSEHQTEMLATLLVYKACDTRWQVCKWLKKGKDITKLSIGFLTNAELMRWDFYCHCFLLCYTKVLGIDVIMSCEISMRDV